MIWTSFQFLIVVWILGLTTGHTLGGAIHLLPVLAVVSVTRHMIFRRLARLRSRS
jgi:hypothetical protein